MNRLPKFLKKYFWEVDFENLDFGKRRVYVLSRILDYGDEKAVVWMWKNFKKTEIRNALANFRGFSQKTANFWALVLGMPKGKVKCLQMPYLAIRKQSWLY